MVYTSVTWVDEPHGCAYIRAVGTARGGSGGIYRRAVMHARTHGSATSGVSKARLARL